MEVLLALILLLLLLLIIMRRNAGAMPHGMFPVADPEVPSVTQRVQDLIQPLPPFYLTVLLWKPGPVFSLSLGGREAFLYELRYATDRGHGHNYQRAYVVLGAGGPYLRAMPRGMLSIRERPDGYRSAFSIRFPEDRPFSKAFWVEGTDEAAIRRYLGPQLRGFLLAHARGWRFNAGPEGVALVHRGRTPAAELLRAALILERLATETDAPGW